MGTGLCTKSSPIAGHTFSNYTFITGEANNETLDLSRRGLKKIEKAPAEESKSVINLVLDQNELQRLDNIDSYSRLENVRLIFSKLCKTYENIWIIRTLVREIHSNFY